MDEIDLLDMLSDIDISILVFSLERFEDEMRQEGAEEEEHWSSAIYHRVVDLLSKARQEYDKRGLEYTMYQSTEDMFENE